MKKRRQFHSTKEAFEAGVREGVFRYRIEARGAETNVDWEAVVEDIMGITFSVDKKALLKKKTARAK
jgi:hypothetical protein